MQHVSSSTELFLFISLRSANVDARCLKNFASVLRIHQKVHQFIMFGMHQGLMPATGSDAGRPRGSVAAAATSAGCGAARSSAAAASAWPA